MESAEADKQAAQEQVSLDTGIAQFVEATAQSSALDLETMVIEEALKLVRPVFGDSAQPENSEDRWVDIGNGRNIRVRLYFPEARSAVHPVLMHLHGGGFVGGTVEMDDARCCTLARQADCLVASVDYPLAPECPFPGPIEAAFAVWQWLGASASELGIDRRRMAVSGSSAGGHLAIGVCLLARERGAPRPVLQLLAYPVVDPSLETGSYEAFADGPFLTRARMAWYWKQYAGTQPRQGQLCTPLSGSLAGLPPALIITAEYDVLRDEGEAYGKALAETGIDVAVRRHAGMIHGFLTVAPDHGESASAIAECVAALTSAFAGEE